MRAVDAVCENGNAVVSFRENGDEMVNDKNREDITRMLYFGILKQSSTWIC